jgi:hypothetical protein
MQDEDTSRMIDSRLISPLPSRTRSIPIAKRERVSRGSSQADFQTRDGDEVHHHPKAPWKAKLFRKDRLRTCRDWTMARLCFCFLSQVHLSSSLGAMIRRAFALVCSKRAALQTRLGPFMTCMMTGPLAHLRMIRSRRDINRTHESVHGISFSSGRDRA